MWVSLNEIEATARTAARCAGYSTGLAQQTGAAARWLALHGLPFLRPLTLGVLKRIHELESFESASQTGSSYGPNVARHRLGPVSVLTALSAGLLALPADRDEISFRNLAGPVLLVPVFSRLSRAQDRPLLIRWPGIAIECQLGEVEVDAASGPALDCVSADWVAVTRLEKIIPAGSQTNALRHQGAELDAALWRELTRLAERTHIWETETARQHGLGAGLTDGD